MHDPAFLRHRRGRPLSIYADLHDTGQVDEAKLETRCMKSINLKPRGIREHLGLNRPIYARTRPTAISAVRRKPTAVSAGKRPDLAEALRKQL